MKHSSGFMINKFILIIVSLLFASSVCAENYYVDDTLRVGIRAKPDKTLPSIMVVQSGASVELLEKQGSYAKVRTSNGIEGWVKSAYLTSKAPAIAKFKQASEQIEQLESQIRSMKAEMSSADTSSKEIVTLKSQIQKLENEKAGLLEKLDKSNAVTPVLNQAATHINSPLSANSFKIDKQLLYVIGGAVIVLLSLGFLIGVSWHKKQVTKRLGGLSI